ncbi:MAG: DUF2058 domain-containing protein [Gammaproteobacteria bacterium]|nr:DUF2058 domain-containing protein [Gammaproteobacteria bacterium]
MSSLQDQLLKAGLVDSKKAKQVDKETRKQNKIVKKSSQPVINEIKMAAEQNRLAKLAKDRALNEERENNAQKKAIAAQIKQLVANNKLSNTKGDITYNFTFEKKIKSIYISETARDHLLAGHVAIIADGDNFELLPRVIADKITERNPAMVVPPPQQTLEQLEDDPYADYPIPDDLIW